jgi:hypothetical protein
MYHEITDFFIAWLRKDPPPPFDQWTWDSRRDLAIKGLTITHIYQHQDIQRWTQTAISDAIAPDDEQGGARAWADRSRNDCADGP